MNGEKEQQPLKKPEWLTKFHTLHDAFAEKAAASPTAATAVEALPATSSLQDQLHEAATRHAWPEVQALIVAGVVPAEKTLSFIVEQKSWPGWAGELIKAGATPTAEMLHSATTRHEWDTVKILIKGGAVPAEKTLSLIVEGGSEKWSGWAGELIKAGAKPTSEMLHNATTRGDLQTAQSLIAGGAAPYDKTLEYVCQRAWTDWPNLLIKAMHDNGLGQPPKNTAQPAKLSPKAKSPSAPRPLKGLYYKP